jgi:hypothetical protein
MADRLSIYNDALLLVGERAVANLSENREPRRLLDQVWNSGGVKLCLEEGQWNFAMRSVQIAYDPDITPSWGYRYAFSKPDDWVLTSAFCSDEFFRVPITRYSDETSYWYSDSTPVYVRYVSDDDGYGMNLNHWPKSFAEFVAAHFATRLMLKMTNDEDRLAKVEKLREKFLTAAKNKNAMGGPTLFSAQGTWSKARQRFVGRRDGGTTGGNLIG